MALQSASTCEFSRPLTICSCALIIFRSNQSDYTRFARRPRDQIISQIAIVPMGTIINALIGIIVTSWAAQLYPDEGLLWQPYDLFKVIQKASGNSSRARAAIAFASIAFIMAQL